jgi:N6-L-threonylcarbamoyladenine synthase
MLLAIESSCDESAAAIFDIKTYISGGCTLLESLRAHGISSQVKLHQQYGGVVPELASREHVKNIPLILEEVLISSADSKNVPVSLDEISVICVTCGPGLKGCLLSGISFAKGLAMQLGVPLLPENHLAGHVLSALLCEDIDDEGSVFPALCVLVSGGHTQLLLCREPGVYECLVTTMDDAAGEAFDKVGTLLGLPYPAGAAVSRLAEKAKQRDLELPVAVPKDDTHFSFSGLKTAAARMIQSESEAIKKNHDRTADIAYALEKAVVEALSRKAERSIREKTFPLRSVFLTGGVAANQRLRGELSDLAKRYSLRFLVPPIEFCTDNAAMIGAAASVRIKSNPSILHARESHAYDFSALPRFPLSSGVR